MNINLDTVHLTLIAWQKSVPIFYRFCKPHASDGCPLLTSVNELLLRAIGRSENPGGGGSSKGLGITWPPGLNRVIWFDKIWWGRGPPATTALLLLLLSASLEQEICLYPSMHVIKFDLKDKEQQSKKVKLFFVLFWISTAFWTPLTYELWKNAKQVHKDWFISYWCTYLSTANIFSCLQYRFLV